jgi:hypothetical protein
MKVRSHFQSFSRPVPQTRPRRQPPPAIGARAAAILAEVARATRYAEPEITARWKEIAGAELAAVSRPGKLGPGPGARAFEVVVASGAAAQAVEFAAPALIEALNRWYGPGAIDRIAIAQTGRAAAHKGGLGRFRAG